MKKWLFVLIFNSWFSYLGYFMPKYCWLAMQMGLYRTLIGKKVIYFSKRQRLAIFISLIKLSKMSYDKSSVMLADFLYSDKYKMFHKTLLLKLVFHHQDVVFRWLDKTHVYQKDLYYLGIYAVLVSSKLDIDSYKSLLESYKETLKSDFYLLMGNHKDVSDKERMDYLNTYLSEHDLMGVSLKYNDSGFAVHNFDIELKNYHINTNTKVSILVTTHNSQKTIENCILSLINQSWGLLEIIVIDDCSQDDTIAVVRQLMSAHQNIKLVAIPCNVGTFVAKSIGEWYATGEFLTCQDSDDWAHPQKIEHQIKPLLADNNLVASLSCWLRIDSDGNYHARQVYPLLRSNPASPLFRREEVKSRMGLWHGVRTGADSEFIERLKLVYGDKAIVTIKKPLTLASHRANSLMTSSEFGAYNDKGRRIRQDYWENWQIWHLQYGKCFMPDIKKQCSCFDDIVVPSEIRIDKNAIHQALHEHKLITSTNLSSAFI
ncbi:MAG: glycosyltransferase family 2 protein [Moraxella sp.]|nr:glycosyltransferase family 2 protein [Moraxella sp.]